MASSFKNNLKKTTLTVDSKLNSPKLTNSREKSSMKKNISIDSMFKLEHDRRNSESPSPNSVSDDSLFEGITKSSKKVTFNKVITVINNNNNNSPPIDTSPNSHQINNHELMRGKRAFIKKLKLDQDSNNSQENCGVKKCSTDVLNDYVCVIS
jgi:hypothetical protein